MATDPAQGLSLLIQEPLASRLLPGGQRDGWEGRVSTALFPLGVGSDICPRGLPPPDWEYSSSSFLSQAQRKGKQGDRHGRTLKAIT